MCWGTWAYVCACVWDQRLKLKSLPLLPYTLSFETGSLSEPRAHWLARLISQWALVIFLSPLWPHPPFMWVLGNLNSGLHASAMGTWPTEPSLLNFSLKSHVETRNTTSMWLLGIEPPLHNWLCNTELSPRIELNMMCLWQSTTALNLLDLNSDILLVQV